MTKDFSNLTPDAIIGAVEAHMDVRLTGLTSPFTSYINRVYELQQTNGTRLVAKFYRPGRWELSALEDEHHFLNDCKKAEIPVIAPLPFANGKTIAQHQGIYFTVFPKMAGRQFEINTESDWTKLGRVIGRMHMIGAQYDAPSRLCLDPENTTAWEVNELLEGSFVTPMYEKAFQEVTTELLETITPLFNDIQFIRIHGDCHNSNFLDRLNGEVLMIDFDDMLVGPSVQDLWLLLPDHMPAAKKELNLMLRGYEQFREFNDRETYLIEPLRAMRIIYFLQWCSTQKDDFQFQTNFPNWGNDSFWAKEIKDLTHQNQLIKEQEIPPFF